MENEGKKHLFSNKIKFLDAYTEEDGAIFFGRDKEIEEINAILEKTRLMVLYGPSGVGKTSLLQCGLKKKIQEQNVHALYIRRKKNIILSLTTSISGGKELVEDDTILKNILPEISCETLIKQLCVKVQKPIWLIFDQLEELFILGSLQEKRLFILELSEILKSEIPCKIILGIREEYWSELYDFESEIPEIFESIYRIRKIDNKGVQAIIRGTAKSLNIRYEKDFPSTFARKIKTDKGIELPHLQIYLGGIVSKIDNDPSFPIFSLDLLDKTETFEDVLKQYLEGELSRLPDPKTGLHILKTFVTKDGTKRQLNSQDVLYFSRLLGNELELTVIKDYLFRFIKAGIIREKNEQNRYELMHDCLALKIYEKIEDSEKELYEIDHVLLSSLSFYQKKNILLNKDELDYIKRFENKVLGLKEFQSIVEKSRFAIKKKETRRKTVNYSMAALILLFIVVSALFFIFSREYKFKINKLGEDLAIRSKKILHLTGEVIKQSRIAEDEKKLNVQKSEELQKLRADLGLQSQLVLINQQIAEEQRKLATESNNLAKSQLGKILSLQEEIKSVTKEVAQENLKSKALEMQIMEIKAKREVVYVSSGNIDLLSKSNELALKAILKIEDAPSLSFRLAETAYHMYKSQVSTQALISSYNSPLFSKCRLSARKSKLLIIAENSLGKMTIESHFSPDGKTIIIPSQENSATIWDLSGNEIIQLKGHTSLVVGAKFSPTGNFIITYSNDKTARLWNTNGKLKAVLKGHKGHLTNADFSFDEQLIITSSWDKKAILWDTSGNPLKTLEGHKEAVKKVSFSEDGNYIVTGSLDNTVRLWNREGKELVLIELGEEKFSDVYFSPHSHEIVVVTDKASRIFEPNGNLRREYIGGIIEIAPDGQQLLSIYLQRLYIADFKGKMQIIAPGNSEWIMGAKFSPDGKFFVSRSFNIAKVWDRAGNELYVLKGHTKKIENIEFSPNGKNIITTSIDGTARLWLIDPVEILKKVNEENTPENIKPLTPLEKQIYGIPEGS